MSSVEAQRGLGYDQFLAGVIYQRSREADRFVTDELRNLLFANDMEPRNVGEDLIARNIQRGRDHGVPSYAAYAKAFNHRPISRVMDCWRHKPREISLNSWRLLRQAYLSA